MGLFVASVGAIEDKMNATICKRYVKRLLKPIPRSYGPDFRKWRTFLEDSQWWGPERLQQYQDRELAKLIRHCYENVPYYQDMFARLGLQPGDIQSKEDLHKLPCITKDEIRANANSLLAENISLRSTESHTTGATTGTPLAVVLDKRTTAIRLAFEWRYYNWAGYRFGDPIAALRGRQVSSFEKGRRWEYDPHGNQLLLSAFDMSERNMSVYIEKLKEFKPKFVRGYPSNLSLLAQYAREKNLTISPNGMIRGLLTSSETLFPHQRDEISKAFRSPVFDLYGNTEQAGRLGQCEIGRGYHDFVEHSVIEILNPDHNGFGEIVATSLITYAMPLLRYRTGDMARLAGERCACGRGLRLIAGLEGRKQDVAFMKDGTPLSLTAFFFAVHVPEMSQVRKIQFQQDTPGQLRALVVRGGDYIPGACEKMLSSMNQNLPIPFDIEVRTVDDIPCTTAGKHRFFVSNVGNGY